MGRIQVIMKFASGDDSFTISLVKFAPAVCNLSVKLGSYIKPVLYTTPFSLSVTSCDATAATRGIHYTLTPSAYHTNNNSLLDNTGTANNVGVEILEGATAIAFAGAPKQTSNVTPDGSGAGSVSLAAQYKATGAATAGTVTSVLNWTLVYN